MPDVPRGRQQRHRSPFGQLAQPVQPALRDLGLQLGAIAALELGEALRIVPEPAAQFGRRRHVGEPFGVQAVLADAAWPHTIHQHTGAVAGGRLVVDPADAHIASVTIPNGPFRPSVPVANGCIMGNVARKAPRTDIDESQLEVSKPKDWAAGLPGVAVSVKRTVEQVGPVRSVRALRLINKRDGFDCPGCAWPEPQEAAGEKRKPIEFCENGAKAVAEEATKRRVTPEFFAQHPIAELAERTDYWLGQQGRITEPMVLRPGATHYEPIEWDDAFALIAAKLKGLSSPDEAIFYTSGRTSNEAAFAYQL